VFGVLLCMRFVILAVTLTGLRAQSPADRKEFDVVSVKPSAPDEHNSFMMRNLPGGSLRIAGVPLRMLIMQAYDVKALQIAGGPEWIRTERWDILAKAEGVEGQIPMALRRTMLQALMADRFQLKIHTETKEMPVYALVVDRKGSKLVPTTVAEGQFRNGDGSLTIKKGSTAALTAWLSRALGRVVIDKTDLKGEYDLTLEWTPDPGEGGPESIGLPPGAPLSHVDTNGPSIFTALQEQLGLRLVSQKGPVEIMVIDRVERPSAN
jgi:bla regulator protein blaR1